MPFLPAFLRYLAFSCGVQRSSTRAVAGFWMGGLPLGRLGSMPRFCPYRKDLTRGAVQEYCTYMKRGLIKAFREYLNAKCAGGTLHKHGRYHQLTSGYGDYLYRQDRAKFDYELGEALAGRDHQDFVRSR